MTLRVPCGVMTTSWDLVCESHSVMANSLQPHGLWNFLGQNTGVSSLSLVQGIFPTQGSNTDLLHCRQILYQLSHKGGPRMLEWVAYPFSSRSSWPRNWTKVSCIADGFFASWTTKVRDNNSTSCMRIKWIDFCKAFRTVLDTELNSISINYYFPYITSFICLLPCIFYQIIQDSLTYRLKNYYYYYYL